MLEALGQVVNCDSYYKRKAGVKQLWPGGRAGRGQPRGLLLPSGYPGSVEHWAGGNKASLAGGCVRQELSMSAGETALETVFSETALFVG